MGLVLCWTQVRPGHVILPNPRPFLEHRDICNKFHGSISVIRDLNTQTELMDEINAYSACTTTGEQVNSHSRTRKYVQKLIYEFQANLQEQTFASGEDGGTARLKATTWMEPQERLSWKMRTLPRGTLANQMEIRQRTALLSGWTGRPGTTRTAQQPCVDFVSLMKLLTLGSEVLCFFICC